MNMFLKHVSNHWIPRLSFCAKNLPLTRGTRFAQLLLGVLCFFSRNFSVFSHKKHHETWNNRKRREGLTLPTNIFQEIYSFFWADISYLVYFLSLEKRQKHPAGLQQLGQHSNPNKENHVQVSCIKLLTSTLHKLDERWVVKPFGSSANGFSTKERVIGFRGFQFTSSGCRICRSVAGGMLTRVFAGSWWRVLLGGVGKGVMVGLIVGVGGRVSLKRGQNQRRQPKIVDTFPCYCGTISIIEVEP